MKKTFSFFLVSVMLLCFPLTALAATDINGENYSDLIYKDDTNNTYIGMFDVQSLNAEEKAFYLECIGAFTSDVSSDKFQYVAVACDSTTRFPNVIFLKVPISSKLSFVTIGSSIDRLTAIPYTPFTQLQFTKNKTSGLLTKSYYNKTVSTGSGYHLNNHDGGKYTIIGTSYNCAFDTTLTSAIENWVNPSYSGNLYFIDNYNPKPTPFPTTAPTQRPDPTIKPPPSASPPEIPQGDGKYVPYDTSVWEKFLNYVRGNIGSATNIGFLIFAVIFAIYVVIRIIRKFSKG